MADIRGGHLPLALMSASGRKAKFRCDRRRSAPVEQQAHPFTTLLLRPVALFASLNWASRAVLLYARRSNCTVARRNLT